MNKTALSQLGNFYGTENYIRQPLTGLLITDGVDFLRQNADCFWLIDEIGFAQRQPAILHDKGNDLGQNLQQMQFWTLRQQTSPTSAVLICERDTGDVAWSKEIPYTDFPFDCFPNHEVRIWVAPTWCDSRKCMVAYLPSEH